MELLVVLALMALVLPLLSSLLKEGLAVFDRTSGEAAAQLQVRHKIEVLKQDIRTSKYPVAEPQVLQLFTDTGNGEPASVLYIWEDGRLYRQAPGEERQLFLPDVVEFQPEVDVDSKLVSVRITVAGTTDKYHQPLQKQFSVKVLPRG